MIVTVSDFKAQFPRFTPNYLPIYCVAHTYTKDNIVYYSDTALFYKCKVNSTTNIPTNTTDWEIYSDNVLNYTQNSDI